VFESPTCEYHSTGGALDIIQHVRGGGAVLMLSTSMPRRTGTVSGFVDWEAANPDSVSGIHGLV
jgi:hypothetical protein